MFSYRRVPTHDALSPFMSEWPGVDLSFASSSSSPDDIKSNLDKVESAVCGSTEPAAAFSDDWPSGCLASGSEPFGFSGVWSVVEWESVDRRGYPYIRYQRKLWITRRRCILGWKPKVFPNPRTIKTKRERSQRTKQWMGENDLEEKEIWLSIQCIYSQGSCRIRKHFPTVPIQIQRFSFNDNLEKCFQCSYSWFVTV